MPTPDNAIELQVGGMVHSDWESYDIDSDLLTPADAWHLRLVLREGDLPDVVVPGAEVQVRVGGDLVLTGHIDDVNDETSKDGVRFSIAGRDNAAVLLDCSSPIFTAQMVSLVDIVAKVVRPLGIEKIRPFADNLRIREKINVEPGETAWETLTHAAEANGLWPWFEPDGTLVIGGPDYDKPPVATLVLRRDGRGNNVLNIGRRRSVAGRYSEVTVLGQKPGTSLEDGKHALKATEPDKGMTWYRPRIVVDYEADSEAVCRSRAIKLLADSRLKGFTLQATAEGHRIVAPGQASHGLLWTPGQRVRVISDGQKIDAVFFLMARKFTGGRQQGSRTVLTLKEDRAWVLDAHPHKKKHRLGKNSAPLQIPDVSSGSWNREDDRFYKDKAK